MHLKVVAKPSCRHPTRQEAPAIDDSALDGTNEAPHRRLASKVSKRCNDASRHCHGKIITFRGNLRDRSIDIASRPIITCVHRHKSRCSQPSKRISNRLRGRTPSSGASRQPLGRFDDIEKPRLGRVTTPDEFGNVEEESDGILCAVDGPLK
jgi:hypothetical protein